MRRLLASRLAAERDAGTAVLFASHDADFVHTLADAVLLLDDEGTRLMAADETSGSGD